MTAISLRNVNLFRRTQEEMSYDLKRLVFQSLTRGYKRPSRRHVLVDVSLRIEQGEKVGIIGANGSGKSTLLKVATGILPPTSGKVTVRGRIAPLIELGAGFDPDLSVGENVHYYGVLLGFTRFEMESRVKRILEFAELTDRAAQPLKSLSSGMNARLGFAVATDSDPEVLLLDEVLSVGDERFRAKSSARMQELWSHHTTIIVVSHEMEFVANSCNRVIWLRDGAVVADGTPAEVIPAYRASFLSSPALVVPV